MSQPFVDTLSEVFSHQHITFPWHLSGEALLQIFSGLSVQLFVNKTNFHMKGFALGLALKRRCKATRKSPNAAHSPLFMRNFNYLNEIGRILPRPFQARTALNLFSTSQPKNRAEKLGKWYLNQSRSREPNLHVLTRSLAWMTCSTLSRSFFRRESARETPLYDLTAVSWLSAGVMRLEAWNLKSTQNVTDYLLW